MRECDRVRRGLSQSDGDPVVDGHLEVCEACRTYADALDAVRHHVPLLAPAPPSDLVESVHDDLGIAPATVGSGTPVGWRRFTRRTPAGIMAAVAGGLLGLVIVVALTASPPATDSAGATLEAVGASHAGQGTSYAFDISGEVELRLRGAAQTPGREQLATELGRIRGEGETVDLPGEVTVDYRAQGATDGRGALSYELRWRVAAGGRADGVLEVVTVDERTWVRTVASGWVLTDDVGFDLGVVEVPHHLGEVLAGLDDLEAAGTIEVMPLDGQQVDHLRARTGEGLVVDAWVGQDNGWLRRLRWIPPAPADERDGTSHGEIVVRLRDHGQARFIGVPDEWRTLDELGQEERPPFLPDDAG